MDRSDGSLAAKSGSVEQQAGLLRLVEGLLEEACAAGDAPGGGDVPGQLAEQRQVLEVRLEVADVGLIARQRNADDTEVAPVSGRIRRGRSRAVHAAGIGGAVCGRSCSR